jgi:N-acetylglucosamine malate deacetylase 1
MQRNKVALVVAAHPDDEVLGCGGTMARLANEGAAVHVLLMADGERSRISDLEALSPRRVAARTAAAEAAARTLGCASVELLDLPDNRLDQIELLDIVRRVEAVVQRYQPATVFTHHAGDVNIDHRLVHDAVIAACRPQPDHAVQELLFFEVPSSTEWRPPGSGHSFAPNWFVDISASMSRKLEALGAYESELRAYPHPRSIRAVDALAQWRGATVGVAAAEAFMLARKIIR